MVLRLRTGWTRRLLRALRSLFRRRLAHPVVNRTSPFPFAAEMKEMT
jgi:hypothetical protein